MENETQTLEARGAYNLSGLEDAFAETENLQECRGCGRSFNPKALSRHVNICQKVFGEKRTQYDTSDHRKTDDMNIAPRISNNKKDVNKTGKTAKWRMQSEQLRAVMKVNKDISKGKDVSNYNIPDPYAEDRKECPHCFRKFNEEAANRHIPVCAEKAKAKQFNSRPQINKKLRK